MLEDGSQPRCPHCGIVMRDEPGAYKCPSCGFLYAPSMPTGGLPRFDGPSLHGG